MKQTPSPQTKKVIAQNNAYWKERTEAHIRAGIKDDKAYEKELKALYKTTAQDIQKDIDAWVGRYADKEKITYAEAQKRISQSDVEGFRFKAKRYVKEKNFSPKANKELELYNLTMRVSRAELLRRELTLELIALADAEEAMLRRRLTEAYEKELKRQVGILGMSSKKAADLAKSADKVINGSFHSATFSERIWASNKDLQYTLSKGINQSIIRGQHSKQWARGLKKHISHEMLGKGGNATFVANRLAITEVARVQTELAVAAYKKMGYTQYMWIAEPTACMHCRALDGKAFDIDDPDAPTVPLHPFCRCSLAAHME